MTRSNGQTSKAQLERLRQEFQTLPRSIVESAFEDHVGDVQRTRRALVKRVSKARHLKTSGTPQTLVLENEEFQRQKRELQQEIAVLYDEKEKAQRGEETRRVEKKINAAVIAWNERSQPHKNRWDLHGMTWLGAHELARRLVSQCPRLTRLELVTGQGHHSTDKKPVIKERLTGFFDECTTRKCTVEEQRGNPGILVVLLH